jgi:hypothetical protein
MDAIEGLDLNLLKTKLRTNLTFPLPICRLQRTRQEKGKSTATPSKA